MEAAPPQVLAKLVSTNKARMRNLELTSATPVITIGRDPANSVPVPDQRISGFHCVFSVVKENEEVKFKLEDKSSNGTFINQKKVPCIQVGRGSTAWLENGDEIMLLNEALVGTTDALGFSFTISENSLKRKLPAEAPPAAVEVKKPKVESRLSEDLNCVICTEIIHQCVTLMPCLHNVSLMQCCGGCYSLWMERSTECPNCRSEVAEVKRNVTVSNIIESYLASNPEQRRTPEELKDLEATNKITHDSMVVGKKAPATTPAKCAQCDHIVGGFKCKANQEHVQCAQCHTLLPVRNPSRIHCSLCRLVNCSLYLANRVCKDALGPLRSFAGLLGTIPAEAFRSNEVEKKVLQDYIAGARVKLPDIAEEMIVDMLLQNWDLPIYDDQPPVRLQENALLCKGCATKVWCELLYKYRLKINHLVPVFVRNKAKCHHGRECRTQRKKDHAERYNHICEKQ